MVVVRDVFGDPVEVLVDEYGDRLSLFVTDVRRAEARLTPKKARKIAKALRRAADEAEARRDA